MLLSNAAMASHHHNTLDEPAWLFWYFSFSSAASFWISSTVTMVHKESMRCCLLILERGLCIGLRLGMVFWLGSGMGRLC